METLPFLAARESVTEYIKTPGINSRVLAELAKDKRLFRRDDARLALVSHPKTAARHTLALSILRAIPSPSLCSTARSCRSWTRHEPCSNR